MEHVDEGDEDSRQNAICCELFAEDGVGDEPGSSGYLGNVGFEEEVDVHLL